VGLSAEGIMPRRGDEAMDAFLLSLSHGPLAIVLPILWLLSLPASIFAFKRLCKFPSVVSFWARALILATQLLLTVLVFLGLSHFQCGGDRKILPQRPRHLEGDIYAFVDGHAKWIRRSNAFNLRWKP